MRSLFIAVLLAAWTVGCRTTTDDAGSSAQVASQENGREVGALSIDVPERRDCPPAEVACSQDEDPALCTASTYEGRTLPDSLVVRAWGANSCKGQVALAKQACALGLRPAALGQSQCAPDASGGNCPVASVACKPEAAPTVCRAGRYGDQPLNDAQALKAWGGSPCEARLALSEAACRRNLNPQALGDVTCVADPQAGECPPQETLCSDAPRRSRCEVRRMVGQALTEPIEARGDSACEAKQRLMRLVCERGLRPSALEDMVCRFGK